MVILEKQAERIDREETAALFLGSSWCDKNTKRSSVLSNLDAALAESGVLDFPGR